MSSTTTRRSVGLAAALFLLPSLASGQAAGPAAGEKKLGSSTAGAADKAKAAAADLAKGPIDISAAAEQTDAKVEAFVAEKEKLVEDKRQRMIGSLVQIIQNNPYYAGKAGVLFRLAELEWESARYHYFLTRKKWEKEYEAFLDGTVKVQPPEPKPDYSQALTYYKQILQEFPQYERLDEVMYYLGKGLVTAGKSKEGASYFSRLIKQFPGSKYLPDSYFQVAEYYFNNDLLFAARTNYQEVLKYKDSPLYQFALYKLAWVFYNLKEWRMSIDTMKSVIAGVGTTTNSQQKIQFKNQAMNDLVLSFAEVPDGWKEMRDYFMGMGGEKLARDKLRKIAGKYVADDKNEEAIDVWRYFLEIYTNEPTAVTWYASIIDSVKKLEDRKRLERVMRESVVFFDPKGTWAVVNRNNKPVFAQALTLAEDSLDFVATWYHSQAQKVQKEGQRTEAKAYYTQAAKDYEEFLIRFPKSDKAYKVRFYQAEIYYYELFDWNRAAASYLQVVKANTKDGEFLEDSAFNSVLAARNIMDPAASAAAIAEFEGRHKKRSKKKKGVLKKASKDDVKIYAEDRQLNPQPLTTDEERFIEAAESFRLWLPKSHRTPEVMFYAASVLQKKDQLDKAIPQLETIVTYHPQHKYAGHAANSLFGACALLKKWPRVEKWARFLIEKRNFVVTKKEKLQEIIAISLNHQSEDLQKAGKFPEAADKMVALAREFPKHELAPKAMFNAAAIHENGKRTDRALELYDEVLRLYPKDEVAPAALFVIGAIFEARTEYAKAADRFEQMQTYKDDGKAADAIYNAGMIREALGRYDGALRAFDKYMELYGAGRPDSHEVYFHMAEIKEKNGNVDTAKKHYEDYIKKYPKQTLHGMRANLALTKMTAANPRQSTIYMRRILSGYKKLKAEEKKALANSIAAEAQFLIGEQIWMSFKAQELPFPDEKNVRPFQKAMVSLAKMLASASAEYFKVFEFKSHGWTVAAATRVGLLYHRFRDKLFNVPMPPGLSEEEQDTYRFLLDDKAFPLEEKAIEAYVRALQLAKENQVYNKWGARAARELASINPETFPITGEDGVRFSHQGDFIYGTSMIASAQAPPPPVLLAPPPMQMPGQPGMAPPPAGQPNAPSGAGAGAGVGGTL